MAGQYDMGFRPFLGSLRRHPAHLPLLQRRRIHLVPARPLFASLHPLLLGHAAAYVPPLFPLLHPGHRIHSHNNVQHLHRYVVIIITNIGILFELFCFANRYGPTLKTVVILQILQLQLMEVADVLDWIFMALTNYTWAWPSTTCTQIHEPSSTARGRL